MNSKMKERILAPKERYFLFVLVVVITFFSCFISSHLIAHLLYKKALHCKKPTLTSEKVSYYSEVVALLTRAIRFNENNADYKAKKANYLALAWDDGFGAKLAINEKEIEQLYKEAIRLNPINFEYHLNLGWFYVNRDAAKAEEELLKAVSLFPTDYQIYLYLYRYYSQSKKEDCAFANLISALYYARNISWRTVMDEAKSQIQNLSGFLYDEKAKELKFTACPLSYEFDFKKRCFSCLALPLNIKIYIKKGLADIRLYKDNSPCASFKFKGNTGEFDIYELNLELASLGTSLCDFKIKVDPPSAIEKIEFTKKFQ